MSGIIARLYAYDENQSHGTKHATKVIENAEGTHRFVPAPNTRSPTPQLSGRFSRETTAEPEEDTSKKMNDLDKLHSIQLTFDDPILKNGEGIMFGWNPDTCDIVMPKIRGISREHCYLTFNDRRQLMVRDRSTNGTTVTYNGQGRTCKKNFTWIIGGDDFLESFKVIILELHERVKFQIVVPPFDPDSYAHMDHVAGFKAQMEELRVFPIGQLGLLDRAPTLPYSEMASKVISTSVSPPLSSDRCRRKTLAAMDEQAEDKAIRLTRGELGRSSYGYVKHVWDVSTGIECASKIFFNAGKFDWKGEVDRMKKLSHINIVELIDYFERPEPALLMEYIPCGNLLSQWKHSHFSHQELKEILVQSLAALEYLHGRKPPVVHRDIKSDNILVQSRAPMHIKVSDFGLSKAGDSLHTLCGTYLYLAPEIFALQGLGEKGSYTAAVDIWSLGVTILQFGYGLPRYSSSPFHGPNWCQRLVRDLHIWEPDGFDVLYSMLVIAVEERASASTCRQYVLASRAQRSARVPVNTGDATCPITQELCDDEATIPLSDGRSPGCQGSDRNSSASVRDQQPDTLGSISRSSTQPDAPTIIQGQVWPPSSSSRKPRSGRSRDETVYAQPWRPNQAATRTIAKRGRSTASDPTATTSSGIRSRQRKKKNTAKLVVSERFVPAESIFDLFGEGWLKDPNCVGASVAAMGQSESDWSSWNSQPGTHVPAEIHHAEPRSNLNDYTAAADEADVNEEHLAHLIADFLYAPNDGL
ncbi:hypothetical protein EG328_007338 [Venturia inaequalis]|uniref:non-specific serine/threonine protein kinase n=1 Tax=Venturia inaequalis TaxID=5025 RepID=A0A8H3YSN9_VENIN|nr:hypothetical protein EG328_007338 [Venturia inaequalis]